jgi:hypothetical protein
MFHSKKPLKNRVFYRYLDYGLAVLFVGILTHHLVQTLLYLMPPNPLKNSVADSVKDYMVPFFSQNWHLFSPNPGKTYVRLEVQCPKFSSSDRWMDIEQDRQNFHEWTRISGTSKVLAYYRTLGDTLWKRSVSHFTACLKDGTMDGKSCYANSVHQIKQSPLFEVAQQYALKACEEPEGGSVPLRVTQYSPVAFSKRTQAENATTPVTFDFFANVEGR